MNRIVVVGSGGSGKSTFSGKISNILNIPVYYLDTYFWKPDWKEINRDEWFEINSKLIQEDSWVIDGNFKSTMRTRMERADTIIYLDLPRIQCLLNAFKRYFRYYKKTRPDMADGCFEKIDIEYYRWIWIYRKRFRPVTLKNIEDFGKGKEVFIFKTTDEAELFLDKLKQIKPQEAGQP